MARHVIRCFVEVVDMCSGAIGVASDVLACESREKEVNTVRIILED